MKPTKAANEAIKEALLVDLLTMRTHVLSLEEAVHIEDAWAGIETFCAIALRVMAKTNASKLRSEMMTVEIAARMAGVEILE
jgi:beta-phosphoglucomutase-like phosphatase (HAD superfamily)